LQIDAGVPLSRYPYAAAVQVEVFLDLIGRQRGIYQKSKCITGLLPDFA